MRWSSTQACRDAGINPIIGYEAYVAPGSRFDRSAGAKGETSYHLTLLAANRTGFENLMQLSSKAFLEGFYHKPRIDRELLEPLTTKGIICLSGCVSGELSRTLLAGNTADEALARGEELAAWFHRVFGDRYFIEIQNNGLDMQRQAMELSVDAGEADGPAASWPRATPTTFAARTPSRRTCCCASTRASSAPTRTACAWRATSFICAARRKCTRRFPGMKMPSPAASKSPTASTCSWSLASGTFPSFAPPAAKTTSEYLRELCEAGLRERYADDPRRWQNSDPQSGELSDEVRQRLDRELRRHREARLLRLLPHRVGLRALRRRSGTFPARPAARASARSCATR